ncbi:MAG: hypothetical protein Ct9H300mP15_19540 [Gemmatimonadota bacterium]|nr:MAG: hypothetical protein Ct9H300mP15_19540 [Gemmatimonadota bacterium]
MGALQSKQQQLSDIPEQGLSNSSMRRGNYYFLEMNTRIQVEHPVTELVTGVDLVDWQIRIASGEALDFNKRTFGYQGTRSSAGSQQKTQEWDFYLLRERNPPRGAKPGPGVRWDGGIREGSHISQHYDPLIGKLIVHANTREGPNTTNGQRLDELVILGVENCASLQRRVMDEPILREGTFQLDICKSTPNY